MVLFDLMRLLTSAALELHVRAGQQGYSTRQVLSVQSPFNKFCELHLLILLYLLTASYLHFALFISHPLSAIKAGCLQSSPCPFYRNPQQYFFPINTIGCLTFCKLANTSILIMVKVARSAAIRQKVTAFFSEQQQAWRSLVGWAVHGLLRVGHN